MNGGRVLTVAGAKGGVGKTTTSINLGAALADAGTNVILVEGDLAMANLRDYLAFQRGPNLHDVLAGKATLPEAIRHTSSGLDVLPSGTEIDSYVDADADGLAEVISTLREGYHLVIVDTGAGMDDAALRALALADVTVLVSTPRLAAVRDASKTVELADRVGGAVAGVVFTRKGSSRSPRVDQIAEYLDVPYLGHVPEDEAVVEAQDRGLPVVTKSPDSPAAKVYRNVSAKLIRNLVNPDLGGRTEGEGGSGDIDLSAGSPPAVAPDATADDPSSVGGMDTPAEAGQSSETPSQPGADPGRASLAETGGGQQPGAGQERASAQASGGQPTGTRPADGQAAGGQPSAAQHADGQHASSRGADQHQSGSGQSATAEGRSAGGDGPTDEEIAAAIGDAIEDAATGEEPTDEEIAAAIGDALEENTDLDGPTDEEIAAAIGDALDDAEESGDQPVDAEESGDQPVDAEESGDQPVDAEPTADDAAARAGDPGSTADSGAVADPAEDESVVVEAPEVELDDEVPAETGSGAGQGRTRTADHAGAANGQEAASLDQHTVSDADREAASPQAEDTAREAPSDEEIADAIRATVDDSEEPPSTDEHRARTNGDGGDGGDDSGFEFPGIEDDGDGVDDGDDGSLDGDDGSLDGDDRDEEWTRSASTPATDGGESASDEGGNVSNDD